MALTIKEKELVNIGASVATGCKPCIDYHFAKARQAGASDEEIKQAISDAVVVRDSAKQIMEEHGLKHLGVAIARPDRDRQEETTRIRELVSIAAAFAVNCTASLEKHIADSRTAGISEEEVTSVLDAAVFIKGEAAHYVSEIVKLEAKNLELQQLLDELKQTQARLVQSEKMAALGKLVAGVVHEMNTPIGAIKSAVDVSIRSIDILKEALTTSTSLEELRNNRKFRGSLEALETHGPVTAAASERISRIVGSLKSFARLDEAAVQEADIHEGLEATLILLERDLEDRVTVERNYGKIPKVLCCPGELNQVFINLLTNAAQAIECKGTIAIRTFKEDAHVHIEISDTGVGIPCEKMEGLFEPDFSKKGPRVKAGLGLFTSYSIVQRHQGELKVKSELGKGSTFTIVLPIALQQPAETAGTLATAQTPGSGHRCDQLSH